jgi:crotonobetainyl-CoA:carnitine CoA-transferase CaiB-like acyl-CoA transferase
MQNPIPFGNIRIADKSNLLTGRLLAQMFADQGAVVYVERAAGHVPDPDDEYLDRNKFAVDPGCLDEASKFDVIIVDGNEKVERLPGQFVVHVVAALPNDAAYGHLPDDCSEDLLNALVGFFTDMGQSSRFLGRPVIYTPLPLCSVYAAVNGANLLGACLYDRERTGQGREIWVSRLAGGVSAIGALALTCEGLEEYLQPQKGGLLKGVAAEKVNSILKEARADGAKQLWLEERVTPLGTPFKTKDGSLVMCIGAANRGLAERLLKGLGIYDEVMKAGFVNKTPFKPENIVYRGFNIGEPMKFSWEYGAKLADMVGKALELKTAAEWEKLLCTEFHVPCVKIRSWDEWKRDKSARHAGIFAPVEGLKHEQIGRTGWIESARPYPPLRGCARGRVDGEPARDLTFASALPAHHRPLEGLRIGDFANVLAGPNCGRMFAELGATVYKVDPINPKHTPEIMVDWAGEAGSGKQSIILNMHTDGGRKIMKRIVATCDMVIANKLDHQWQRMGLDRTSLDQLKSGIIQVAVTGHRGEVPNGERHDYPGYDPALQGATGIMERFGPDGCPTFHGLASCVDYLCGYLGVWAGLCALYAQTRRGDSRGDWAETSLAVAATLTQCLLQQKTEPPSARGADATGMSLGARVYELTDGWIFAQGEHDLTHELRGLTREAALALLVEENIPAVPVQTCRELADRHLNDPTPTVTFERRTHEGWTVGAFSASWFATAGRPLGTPAPAHRVGSDAVGILSQLGYSSAEVDRLVEDQIVGAREFSNTTDS